MSLRTDWARPSTALALAIFLAPPLATVIPLAMPWLLAGTAAVALALGGHRELWRIIRLLPLAVLLGLVGLLGIVSAHWSIVPDQSLVTGARFLVLSIAGLCLIAGAMGLDPAERPLIRRALLVGVGAALVILVAAAVAHLIWPSGEDTPLASWLRGYTRFNRGTTTIALAVWPAMLALAAMGKSRLAATLPVGTLVILLGLVDQSAILSLAVGIAVWRIALWLPRISAGAMGAGLLAFVVLLPLAPLDIPHIVRIHEAVPAIKFSGLHRLLIWHFASERIAERPFLGWGLEASRAIPGGSDRIDDPSVIRMGSMGALWMPLHPHNAALQWRLELGWPGAVLMTLLAWWILRRASTAVVPPPQTAIALALIASTFVVAMLSYGFWQGWWQSSLWIIAAGLLAVPDDPQSRPR